MPGRIFAVAALVTALLPASLLAAGAPTLVDATERGNLAEVRALIKQGTDTNTARVDGLTALHAAVYADRLDITEILLAAGAKATATDRYGVTPLYLAAVNGNADIIRRLLDADPRVVKISDIATLHLGPRAVLVAATLAFRPDMTMAGLREAIRELTADLQRADGRITYVYIRPAPA